MSEEELYKLLNIPYKPWIELTNEEVQLFEKNNNYIKQLQQKNTQLKQQLKDKDEKISKIDTKLKKVKQKYNLMALTTTGEVYDLAQNIHEDILEILESNKED